MTFRRQNKKNDFSVEAGILSRIPRGVCTLPKNDGFVDANLDVSRIPVMNKKRYC